MDNSNSNSNSPHGRRLTVKTAYVIFGAADVDRDLPQWRIIMKVAQFETREDFLSDGSVQCWFTGPEDFISEVIRVMATSRRGVLVSQAEGIS